MQAEERDLISGLYERLRPFDAQPRDPEAERLIATLIARQPSAAVDPHARLPARPLQDERQRVIDDESREGAAAQPREGRGQLLLDLPARAQR